MCRPLRRSGSDDQKDKSTTSPDIEENNYVDVVLYRFTFNSVGKSEENSVVACDLGVG
jgi:hypothetical protein